MPEPMYRLIADDLERQIKSGELARGEQLKSEVELREDYGQGEDSRASRNIGSRWKRGTFLNALGSRATNRGVTALDEEAFQVLLAQRPDAVTPADQAG